MLTHPSRIDSASFAIVLFEIWTRTIPWKEIQVDDVDFQATLSKIVTGGGRPTLPENSGPSPEGYERLLNDCWIQTPRFRPPFVLIVSRLEEMHRNIPMPIYEEDAF